MNLALNPSMLRDIAGAARFLTPDGRLRTVLDTSFWVAASRAGVAANCLDFFEMTVPRAVESEILSVQADAPKREYPYATLFRQLRDKMQTPPDDAPPSLPIFGPGEAAAIPLAATLPAVLLINEHRGARYAQRLDIPVVHVPLFVVALYSAEVISARAAHRKLELVLSSTTAEFVAQARLLLMNVP